MSDNEPIGDNLIPINTFEQFMLADDSSDHPKVYTIVMELDRPLDMQVVMAAANQIVPRFPLLNARIDPEHKNWVLTSESIKYVSGVPIDSVQRIDLTQENGFKIQCDQELRQIGFVFHHACCDGLGAMQFLSCLFENLIGSTDKYEPPIEFLRRRSSYDRHWLTMGLRWLFDLPAMLWSFEMLWNRPVPLAGGHSNVRVGFEEPEAKAQRGFVKLEFDAQQTSQILRQAKSQMQTLNDWLIESSFRATDAWMKTNRPELGRPLVRLLIPVNLRRQRCPTSVNMVAMVNLDRRPRSWRSDWRFRKFLGWEMAVVKRLQLGITANRLLKVQRLLKGGWSMVNNKHRCVATFPVSNLGILRGGSNNNKKDEPFQVGDAVVNRIEFHTMTRPQTNLMVVCYSYRGRINLDISYYPPSVSDKEVEQFSDLLCQRLVGKEV